ncbi:MAG: AbrB/MazE/SpoVT family DNA-binding domain-containing protein [Candidatus Bathyarchaeia archaeon]
MEIRRKMSRKGQLVIPKIIREFLGVGPGDEVIMEVRGREILIKPKIDPVKFVEEFCSKRGKKLTKKIDLERMLEGEVEERLVLR